MEDLDLDLLFLCPKLGGIPMFTFGCSPVLDLDNARLFAQQFQLEEDRPTLRRNRQSFSSMSSGFSAVSGRFQLHCQITERP